MGKPDSSVEMAKILDGWKMFVYSETVVDTLGPENEFYRFEGKVFHWMVVEKVVLDCFEQILRAADKGPCLLTEEWFGTRLFPTYSIPDYVTDGDDDSLSAFQRRVKVIQLQTHQTVTNPLFFKGMVRVKNGGKEYALECCESGLAVVCLDQIRDKEAIRANEFVRGAAEHPAPFVMAFLRNVSQALVHDASVPEDQYEPLGEDTAKRMAEIKQVAVKLCARWRDTMWWPIWDRPNADQLTELAIWKVNLTPEEVGAALDTFSFIVERALLDQSKAGEAEPIATFSSNRQDGLCMSVKKRGGRKSLLTVSESQLTDSFSRRGDCPLVEAYWFVQAISDSLFQGENVFTRALKIVKADSKKHLVEVCLTDM